MDRQKIVSKNPLHKQLFSSSQTAKKSTSVRGLDIMRSVSATNESLSSGTRKRKTSEHQEDKELATSPEKKNAKKKKGDKNESSSSSTSSSSTSSSSSRSSNSNSSSSSSSEEEALEEASPASPSKHPTPDKKNKETNASKGKSNSLDKMEENDSSKSNTGSYIRSLLEEIDRNSAKLRPTANTSSDTNRRINLRTPLRCRLQRPVSKAISDKKSEAAKEKEIPMNESRDLPSLASSKKKTPQKEVSQDEEMTSNKDSVPAKKTFVLKNILPGTSFSKKKTPTKYLSSDDEDMMVDTDIVPAKNLNNETRHFSPERTPVKRSENQGDPNKTPERSQRKSIFDSPELVSPLRAFQDSPQRQRENVTQSREKTINGTCDIFLSFVDAVGITLCSGANSHISSHSPVEVVKKMRGLLTDNSIDINELVRSWNCYIEDEDNLQKSLLEIKIETDEGVTVCSKAISLSKLLLQVPQLQVEILKSLFSKLVDAVMTTDSSDDAPWSLLMLQQFRFLETIIDPDVLVNLIEKLLTSSPEWFQREIIVFIPDIVTDSLHRTTAEMLVKIMENNSDLTNIILDCIHILILGIEYREELREKVLGLLNKTFHKSNVPPITRFILNSCSTEAIAYKSLNVLHSIDMAPTAKEKADECYTYQSFMVNAIKMSIQLFKEVTQAALAIIKSQESKAVPLDVILSILLYETSAPKKKIVETTLLGHIKIGHYKSTLLGEFYNGYKSVAKSFQSAALTLAISLLKADSQSHVEFGIEWIRHMFVSQAETSYRQREIMEKLINLMATKDRTVKNALEVLIRMANDEKERSYLQRHTGFLRIFLEKIDNLHFEEVATLYHLLHGLCTHSESIADILNDDVSMIMQKQLCSSKVQTKCKGVLGAVMRIKHLASEKNTMNEAYQLLRKTITSLKDCKRSETLFYDQLANVIDTTSNIEKGEFLISSTNDLEEHFVAYCLVENSPSTNLVPRFGFMDSTAKDFIYFENCKFGAYTAVLFKLLRICNYRLDKNLEDIHHMLEFPILMPEDLDMQEPSTADIMIHCINWFREVIGAFVTQEDTMLRKKVLERLESLMSLQGEFVTMVAMLESRYQPPPCYFNHFPTPQFVRLDLKMSKKGRKGKKSEKKEKDTGTQLNSTLSQSIILPEWETWEKGSVLTVKNPAFFRKMDTNIMHLLDSDMDVHAAKSSNGKITIAQVCFIITELLNMLENEVTESFMRDVISLLPKVCKKLQQIVADLRQEDNVHEKEAARLIFCLFICTFNWKEFTNSTYYNLLRDGLRALAGMMKESSSSLRSCKDLVVEAYKYFESLSDVATQITLAVALVKLCETMMNHSGTFRENSQDRQAKMAYGFLCLQWNESHGPEFRAAVKELLKNWLENEPDPLKTVSSVLEWLPEEASNLDKAQSHLNRMPSVTKMNFHLFFKQLFVAFIKGIRVSLKAAESDPERIKTWLDTGKCLGIISDICKTHDNNLFLTCYLRYTAMLYQILLSSGMSVLEENARYQSAGILDIMKLFQKSNKFLGDIFCTARKDKNVALLKLIPGVKSKREQFIYRVKGLCTANNCIGSFWMGKLLYKELDGEGVDADSSDETIADLDNNSVGEAGSSEILDSESDEDINIDEA